MLSAEKQKNITCLDLMYVLIEIFTFWPKTPQVQHTELHFVDTRWISFLWSSGLLWTNSSAWSLKKVLISKRQELMMVCHTYNNLGSRKSWAKSLRNGYLLVSKSKTVRVWFDKVRCHSNPFVAIYSEPAPLWFTY